MKNILWVSRHEILPCELDVIKEIFSDEGYTLFIHNNRVPSAEWLVTNVITKKKIDIVIPVLPLTVISELAKLSNKFGFEVWWSDMETVKIVDHTPKPLHDYNPYCEAAVRINGKFKIVRFNKFYRLRGIKLILDEIKVNRNVSD